MTNSIKKILRGLILVSSYLSVASQPGAAGAADLVFWEASSSPAVPLLIAPPASDFLLDIDYAPNSAEGGGLYGMSEVFIAVTGDLTLTTTGLSCQTFGCLSSPSPFSAGAFILLSGADNLAGEFTSAENLLTIGLSGTVGHVVLARGRYLDAGGVAQSIGNIQDIDGVVLATVPEPTFGVGLIIGAGLIAARSRNRRPSRSRSRSTASR